MRNEKRNDKMDENGKRIRKWMRNEKRTKEMDEE